jgi:hypothetical protein
LSKIHKSPICDIWSGVAEIDGHDIPDSKERVLALGPGVMYISDEKKDLFWVNFYDEVLTKNRPDGVALNVRWLHVF